MPRASLLGSNLHTNNTRHFGSMAGLAPTSTLRPNITGLAGYKVAAVAANQHRNDGSIIASNQIALNNGCGLGKNSSDGANCLKHLGLRISFPDNTPIVDNTPSSDNTPAVSNTPATPAVLSLNLRSTIDGEVAGDRAGYAGGLSSNADGSIIAIGAYKHDSSKGHVRIYQWNGSSLTQLGSDIDGENGGDESGYAVSLSSDGTIIAIGSPRHDALKGHVRIYKWDGSTWNQLGSDIDGENGGDESGFMISLNSDGTIVAIGSEKNDAGGGANDNVGHLRVYQWDGSSWNQMGDDIDGEAIGDYSGRSSLSSDGTIVAIGAYQNDGNGIGSGHVRVYKWDGSSWNQVGADIDGEAAGDQSGRAVSLSSDGTIVAIGAPTNDSIGGSAGGGHLRVYQWDGSAWNQVGDDIDASADDAWFGMSISLSSDGTILAAGGGYSNGAAGRARIYQWDGSIWNQVGDDIDGEAANDLLGSSIALSNDGSLLLVPAYNHNNQTGRVYIYETY